MGAESAEPVPPAGLEDHLRAIIRLARESAEGVNPDDLAALLRLHDAGKASPAFLKRVALLEDSMADHREHSGRPGRARKVSVSMPEDLTATVQRRVGKGEFSQYVTAAVTRQLELDLLAELSALLEADHGAIPEEFLAEAEAAWPDAV